AGDAAVRFATARLEARAGGAVSGRWQRGGDDCGAGVEATCDGFRAGQIYLPSDGGEERHAAIRIKRIKARYPEEQGHCAGPSRDGTSPGVSAKGKEWALLLAEHCIVAAVCPSGELGRPELQDRGLADRRRRPKPPAGGRR